MNRSIFQLLIFFNELYFFNFSLIKNILNEYKALLMNLYKLFFDFKKLLIFFVFVSIFLFYIKCVYFFYLILLLIWYLIFLFIYAFNKPFQFFLKSDFFEKFNYRNFFLFIFFNFFVKLPIYFSFIIFYKTLYAIFKKNKNNAYINQIIVVFFNFLFRLVFSCPYFVLNKAYDFTNIFFNNLKFYTNLRCFLVDLLANITIASFSNIIILVFSLKIDFKDRGDINFNPGDDYKILVKTSGEIIKELMKTPNFTYGCFEGQPIPHLNYVIPLKPNVTKQNALTVSFTSKEDINIETCAGSYTSYLQIVTKGYSLPQHWVTYPFLGHWDHYKAQHSSKMLDVINKFTIDKEQLIAVNLAIIANWEKPVYGIEGGKLTDIGFTLKGLTYIQGFDIFENPSYSELFRKVEEIYQKDPLFFSLVSLNKFYLDLAKYILDDENFNSLLGKRKLDSSMFSDI